MIKHNYSRVLVTRNCDLKIDDLIDSLDNVVGRNSKHLQESIRRSRPGDSIDCHLADDHVAVASNSIQNSVSNTTLERERHLLYPDITAWTHLWIVILHSDDPSITSSSIVLNSLDVQRLDGEGVHDSDVDTSLCKGVSSLESFKESDSSSHHQHLVIVRLPQDLGLSNLKLFVIGIDNWSGRAGHTDEANLQLLSSISVSEIRARWCGSSKNLCLCPPNQQYLCCVFRNK